MPSSAKTSRMWGRCCCPRDSGRCEPRREAAPGRGRCRTRTGSLSSIGRSSVSACDGGHGLGPASPGWRGPRRPAGRPTASIDAGSVPVSVKPSPAASISISRTWTVSRRGGTPRPLGDRRARRRGTRAGGRWPRRTPRARGRGAPRRRRRGPAGAARRPGRRRWARGRARAGCRQWTGPLRETARCRSRRGPEPRDRDDASHVQPWSCRQSHPPGRARPVLADG